MSKLSVGQVFYTTMCYEHGGMVDDGTLFRLGENNFRWVGGDDASLIWLKEQAEKSEPQRQSQDGNRRDPQRRRPRPQITRHPARGRGDATRPPEPR